MKQAALSNLETNREVRRILVSHWIDLGRLSIHSVRDSVYLRGSLQKLPGTDADITPANIELIYRKIKGISGVKHVHAEFDNWTRSDTIGAWEHIDAAREKDRKKRTGDAIYDVGE